MPHSPAWPDLLNDFDRASKRNASLKAARTGFVTQARRVLKLPLVRRVYRYGDIGKHRTWLDGRSKPLKEPMQTIFGLAMSDLGTQQTLVNELPLLAAAARLSGDKKLLARLHEQLHEMASWSPLQRPGWCAYGDRLPPDGKDGNWLATGLGVRAIADVMEILGRDALPPATLARLDQLFAAEIVSIVDDWEAKRPWFVQANAPLTNQWVLPTEGLIRACLVLGKDRHRVAYEKGVANLFAHLEAHGPEGAFEEGIHYADFTVTSLLAVARAMALAGDRRAIDHPFLQRFPVWALRHFQPGGFFINSFDAFSAARGNKAMLKGMLALAAVSLGSREALWALDHLAGGADDSLMGLLARALPRPAANPKGIKPFASYTRAMRVDWRSGWKDDATGVWVRGGDRFDSHDHMDRGHVNFILKGKPVFIEAGTPAYHNPRLSVDYASGRGHNVLQLGEAPPPQEISRQAPPAGWQKPQALTPIKVRRLEARLGDIEVNGTAGYDGLKQWRRRVQWDADILMARDIVELADGDPQVVLFRWHLGTTRRPHVGALDELGMVMVTWPGILMSVEADCPVDVAIEMMPDHTMQYRLWDDKRPDHLHACVVVKTREPVRRCRFGVTATEA
ncbi:MAG: heparinase II/III family protein [Planctomycetota bacterium]|nr:heparinase II/III family protein [Planctomycetota bacterium]